MPTLTCLNCGTAVQAPEYTPNKPPRCPNRGGFYLMIDGVAEKLPDQLIVLTQQSPLSFPIQRIEGAAEAGQGCQLRMTGTVPRERLHDLLTAAQALGQGAGWPATRTVRDWREDFEEKGRLGVQLGTAEVAAFDRFRQYYRAALGGLTEQDFDGLRQRVAQARNRTVDDLDNMVVTEFVNAVLDLDAATANRPDSPPPPPTPTAPAVAAASLTDSAGAIDWQALLLMPPLTAAEIADELREQVELVERTLRYFRQQHDYGFVKDEDAGRTTYRYKMPDVLAHLQKWWLKRQKKAARRPSADS